MDFSELVESKVTRVVSAEVDWDGMATLFRRLENGQLEKIRTPFHPWCLVENAELGQKITVPNTEITPLEGEGRYHCRAAFSCRKSYEKGVKELKALTGFNASAYNCPYRVFSDLTQQFLTGESIRLFSGMDFSELLRMQVDIEVRSAGNTHFPDAANEGDEVILISIKDSSGFETCLANTQGEESLLKEFIELFQQRDPDTVEGHNIFNFDLPYLRTRCARYKISFTLGRDGSEPLVRASRFNCAERQMPFTRFDIYGRHVVDTLQLVNLYDVIHRDMDGHGLKTAARYFHVASPQRTYVKGDEITQTFEQDPERLKAYCLDDVRETDGISRILSPSYFYQTALIPYGYQSVVTRGNATRIDALLCAEYLRHNSALPLPEEAQFIQGALTEGELQGVFHNVWHVDVRSLYPSIIAADRLTPSRDFRGEFLRLLTGLRKFRLAAKDARKNAPPEKARYYDALQATFKILINSFYGYTAFAQGTFNDYNMASVITGKGREILGGMKAFLEENGAVIVEMDTDGIYFVPPAEETSPEHMQQRIQSTLPPGIEVEMDACYTAMYGYKSKNYALLHQDGSVTMTGAALKSRGLEPFQRRFIKEVITLRLQGHADEIDSLYEKYVSDIEEHRLPLADFAQKETLSTDPKTYAAKVVAGTAKKSAAYDLAIGAPRVFKQGDTVEFYVIGNKKSVSVTGNSKLLETADTSQRDENIPYYLAKLKQIFEKLK